MPLSPSPFQTCPSLCALDGTQGTQAHFSSTLTYSKIFNSYWHMNFDASPFLLDQLTDRMRTDHRVIRWTMLKLGERLEDVADEETRLTATVSYPRLPTQTAEFSGASQRLPGTAGGTTGWSGAKGQVAGLGGAGGIGELVDLSQLERDRIVQLGSMPYTRERIPEN